MCLINVAQWAIRISDLIEPLVIFFVQIVVMIQGVKMNELSNIIKRREVFQSISVARY